MKCLYFLSPTLSSTQAISDALQGAGVSDFYLHVISRDESGLKKQHIHSSNYLETRDMVRDGFIGAALGMAVGLIGIGLLMYFRPFGDDVQVPAFVYAILVGAATLFGAWEGGLTGIAWRTRSSSVFTTLWSRQVFDPGLRAPNQEETVIELAKERNPDAELVAVDTHFMNPFTSPREQMPRTRSTTV